MKQSGVDISLNDRASEIAFSYVKKSYQHNKEIKNITEDMAFSGGFDLSKLPNHQALSMASDGIGTKIELAERLKSYKTLGYDLLAMVCDDLITNFYKPLLISNILDVDYIDLETIDALMQGLYEASRDVKAVLSGGEIAELGNRIGGFGDGMHFNWGATAIGALIPIKHDLNLRKGDLVYVLKSSGFRSNGFSLARRILKDAYGEFWHETTFQNKSWGDILLTPSTIFSPMIEMMLNQGIQIKKLAHITGGGFYNNTRRVLGDFTIKQTHPLEIPLYFSELMRLGEITEEQARLTWNMGYGMVFVLDQRDKEGYKALEALKQSNYWPLEYIGVIDAK